MILLVLGLVAFFVVHLVPAAAGARARLVGQFGETGYKGLFSVVSVATLAFLVWSFARAPFIEIWAPAPWMRSVTMLAMPVALVVLMSAFFPGAIKKWLKHPMIVAIQIWAVAHLFANGDLASVLLFGGFFAYGVINRIGAGRRDEHMPVPAAGAARRNDLVAVVAGVALYAAFVAVAHEWLIGVALLR